MRGNGGKERCRRWAPVLVALLAFGTACHDEPTAPTEVKRVKNPTMEEVLYGPVVAIDAGRAHTCAVGADYAAVCWGENMLGQSDPPSGQFSQVSAGDYHSCGLRLDGSVSCWGRNYEGQSSAPPLSFIQVTAGSGHSCGLRPDGTVVCWGYAATGATTPPPGESFVQVDAGRSHTCGIRTDGAVRCWGGNSYGEASPPPGTFTQVSAAVFHTCGLRSDEVIVCWGLPNRAAPSGGPFTQVAAGDYPSCGLTTDGSVRCTWLVGAPAGPFTQITAGGAHGCGIRPDGRVECWGAPAWTPPSGTYSDVGVGFAYNACALRTDATVECFGNSSGGTPTGMTFTQLSVGTRHQCALRPGGAVVCWGDNQWGQAAPPSGLVLSQVSAGEAHTCGLAPGGAITCWGINAYGEGTLPPGSYTQVAAGSYYTCALRMDETLACVGLPWAATPTGTFKQISVGGYAFSCGLRADGTVTCWGSGYTPPTGSFVQVAAGRFQGCGVRDDGTLACWGLGWTQDWTPPSGTFTRVAVGLYGACAVRTSGQIECWGSPTLTTYVPNQPPTVTAGGPYTAPIGLPLTLSGTGIDPDGNGLAWNWAVSLAGGGPAPACAIANGSTSTPSVTCDATGSYEIRATVTDGIAPPVMSDVAMLHVFNPNRPPTVAAGGPYMGNEGSAVEIAGVAADPDGDPLNWTWEVTLAGGGAATGCTVANATTVTPGITCADDGLFEIRATVSDGVNAPVTSSTVALTISNTAPALTGFTGPIAPIPLGTNAVVSGNFADPGALDVHSAQIDWGDGQTSAASINETNGTGSLNASHTYAAPGVYSVAATVADDDGGAANGVFQYVVVYDPSAGFVTGGGWIWSPIGALLADPTLEGKATFGIQSRYEKGATVPTGRTQFMFHSAGFEFRSTDYQWMVVAGAKVQFKGTGTVNGAAGYGFLLSARDGRLPGGGGVDAFRIKIWEVATGAVVYDNQRGQDETGDAATTLGGGQIQIHP